MAGKELRGAAKYTHNLKVFGNGSMVKGLERLAAESKRSGIMEERARNANLFAWITNNIFRAKR